jgi:hypothetical protein
VAPATVAAPAVPPSRLPARRARAILEERGAPVTGQRDPHTRVHDEKAAGVLGDRLQLMFDWYKGMVDESTGRVL